ncbi:hypothetical protein [Anaerotignum sp.]
MAVVFLYRMQMEPKGGASAEEGGTASADTHPFSKFFQSDR